MITKQQFWDLAGVKQHSEFEAYLRKIVLDKPEREKFLSKIVDLEPNCVEVDTFKQYFEDYAAERKSNKQDYTPDAISWLLAKLTQTMPDKLKHNQPVPTKGGNFTAADFSAGTGSLLIQKWWFDMTQETPFSYVPHRYFYFAQETADNAIPYLLLNLSLRGMNCIVVHGDTLTGEAKQVYFVENSKDDWLSFSDVNVMPHTERVAKEFGITKWLEPPINHIESPEEIKLDMSALPSHAKPMKINYDQDPKFVPEKEKSLHLQDIADIERAKAKKVYPRGTVVIQISATRGQCGRLTSSGVVESKYACVQFKPYVPAYLMWWEIKQNIPRWLAKYQEDLNVKLEDVGKIPIWLPVDWMIPFNEQEKDEQTSLF